MSRATDLFVSIAAYRDEDLWRTVSDCVARASHPERLHIAILDQSAIPGGKELPIHSGVGRMSYLHLDHVFSRGPCWARHMISTYVREEPYFLQIDSHMRFDEHWDECLLDQLASVSCENDRAIISTYPCAFEVSEGEEIKKPMPGQALVLRPRADSVLSEDSPVLMFQSVPTASRSALPGCHVGAGLLFTRTSLLQEVPIDPWLYFHGEEQNLAVRAWTHGWDIWHPPDMPIYHLYKAASQRPVHWDTEDDAKRSIRWSALNQQANSRLCALFYEARSLGVYGLGSHRCLREYAAFSGIDYENRTLSARG